MEAGIFASDHFRIISELISDYAYIFRVRDDGELYQEWCSGGIQKLTGFDPEEIDDRGGWTTLVHPDDLPIMRERSVRLLDGYDHTCEFRIIRKEGGVRWLRDHGRPLQDDAQDRMVTVVGAVQDITKSRRDKDQLRTRRVRLEAIIRHAPVGIVQIDKEERVLLWNSAAESIFGWTAVEILGKPLPFIPPDKREEADYLRTQFMEGKVLLGRHLIRRRKDGSLINIQLSSSPIFGEDGSVQGSIAVILDITESTRTKQELRAERRFAEVLLDTSPAFFVLIEANGRTLRMNKAMLDALEYSAQEVEGADYLRNFVPPEEHSRVAKVFESITKQSVAPPNENHIISRSGRMYLVDWRGRSVLKTSGEVDFFVGVGVDITERRRAEEEHQKLERQLLQAQRMEAVGLLAGGVAHDFNNMLQSILGNTELALQDAPTTSRLHDYLMEIHKAAEHSSNLTRQLLAFARRQTIAPKILDLNETVSGMIGMMSRLIGEAINLVWRPGRQLWSVYMDPSQVDQILANLVVNARDAIVSTGAVVIETDNRSIDGRYCLDHPVSDPGDYVLLSVSDTGRGIDPEILAQVFDPFFTTKGVGEGTGLGLSTVYGIVQQNQGFINIYTEPGKGSTFTIYLPRHAGHTATSSTSRDVRSLPRGTETILVVEDEPTILDLSRRQLTALGYRVLTAGGPQQALSLAQVFSDSIHLLLTDVIMPEMDGRELAVRLAAARADGDEAAAHSADTITSATPPLKRLFMSGYTADVIAHHGVLETGVHFLQKPFTIATLAAKVREVLDE